LFIFNYNLDCVIMETLAETRKSSRSRKKPDWFSKSYVIPWPAASGLSLEDLEKRNEEPLTIKKAKTGKSTPKSKAKTSSKKNGITQNESAETEKNLLELFDHLEQLGRFNLIMNAGTVGNFQGFNLTSEVHVEIPNPQ